MCENPPKELVELVGDCWSIPWFEAVLTVPDSTLWSLILALAYLIAGVILSGVVPCWVLVAEPMFLCVARALWHTVVWAAEPSWLRPLPLLSVLSPVSRILIFQMPFAFAAEADWEGSILPESLEIELKLMFLVFSRVSFLFELLFVERPMLAVERVAWYVFLSLGV